MEPDFGNRVSGKVDFRLNGRSGNFVHAGVGSRPRSDPKIVTVDSVCADFGIQHLDILHADTQGFEVDMLTGAQVMLSRGQIDYAFISTHSNELHADCISELHRHGYDILADANLDESFSIDGLVVAKHRAIARPESLEVSHR